MGHGVVPDIFLKVMGSVWDHVGHGCRESVAHKAFESMGVAKVWPTKRLRARVSRKCGPQSVWCVP